MDILGIKIDNVDMREAVENAFDAFKDDSSFRYVFTPNAEICMAALKNENLLNALNSSYMNIPDGEGVVIASKILRTPLKEKVPGCEFVQSILNDKRPLSVFLLGTSEQSVTKACEVIKVKYPHILIAGYNNGFFDDSQQQDIISLINEKSPDLIIVGLGAPKQELFIYENRMNFKRGLGVGAGGTIDIISGHAKRAPDFFCKYKLEWLYRLAKQPKRFFRMLNIPLFLIKAVFYNIRTHKKKKD